MLKILVKIGTLISTSNLLIYIIYNLPQIRVEEREIIKLLSLSISLVILAVLTLEEIKTKRRLKKLKTHFLIPSITFSGIIISIPFSQNLLFIITNYLMYSLQIYSILYLYLRKKHTTLITISLIIPLIITLISPNYSLLIFSLLPIFSLLIYLYNNLTIKEYTDIHQYISIILIILIYALIVISEYIRLEYKYFSLTQNLILPLILAELLIFSYKTLPYSILNTIFLSWVALIALITTTNFQHLSPNIIITNILTITLLLISLITIRTIEKNKLKVKYIIEEIEKLLKEITKSKSKFKNESEIISYLNSISKKLKISIIPENKLPNFLLNKMILKKYLSLDEALKSEKATVNFFKNFGIIFIQRLSNELYETKYVLVKYYSRITHFYFPEIHKKELKKLIPYLQEIVETISNLLVIPLKDSSDKKREHQVREIESFEKIKSFLIREEESFVFKDKLIFYKFIEDPEKPKGYYVDTFFKTNGMSIFLIHIPDILMLSKITLLSIKGIIKTLEPEEVSYEKIKNITENFIKERELPLTFSINFMSIENDEITIHPSPLFHNYVVFEDEVKLIQTETKVSHKSCIFVSNKELNINPLIAKTRQENLDFIKEKLWSTNESDSFLMIYL